MIGGDNNTPDVLVILIADPSGVGPPYPAWVPHTATGYNCMADQPAARGPTLGRMQNPTSPWGFSHGYPGNIGAYALKERVPSPHNLQKEN